jgi:hypothetical protein
MRLNQALRDRLRYGMGKVDDVIAFGSTPQYGYFAGGVTGIGIVIATADRITFSTSTTAAFTAANLSQARSQLAGVSDGSTYGYFAGGFTDPAAATADRITFSTSTTAAFTAANLSVAKRLLGSLSDGSTYGYFTGGITGTNTIVATADRITFATGTTAAFTAANLSQARQQLGSVSDGSTYGYFAGGATGATVSVATADRITFSTSTTAAFTAANLSQARFGLFGVSDGSTYGYFAGGATGVSFINVTTADRITFATGTTAAFTAANLSQGRRNLSGVSDGSTYGYFAGGFTGASVATVDRITFSTGTTASFTAANLSQAKQLSAGLTDYAI